MSNVLVIGSGAASAAACLALSKAGRRCTVLEANSRIGGRILTTHEFGCPIDFGASYIHGFEHAHNPAKTMAAELGVEHYVAKPDAGMNFSMDGRTLSDEDLKAASHELSAAAGRVAEAVRGGEDRSYGEALYKGLSATAVGLARVGELGGIPLTAVSAKHYKTEVPLAGIDAMPVGGYTGMLQKAFDKSGADVRLHQQVVKIKDAGDKVQVTTKTGETHTASHVICTVPLTLLNAGTIEFDPPLDASRQRVMKRTSVGVLNKLLLVYPEVWWPPRVSHFLILPTTASIATDKSSARGILTSGPLLVPNLHAGLKDAPAALLCYIGAERGAAIESFSAEEVGTALHEILASVVGGGRAVPSPTKCGMTRWLQDPLALGATTGPVRFQDGAEPADYEKTGEPAWSGKLLFAGEHTVKDWRGSVPGALQSGLREAERLLASA